MCCNQNQRLGWVDAIKGIGIILVLVGHCNIPNVNPYIYLFHMPLFYIISGFCWNVEKNKTITFKEFFSKKFRAYIIPYFKIAAVCFLIFGVSAYYFKMGFTSAYIHQLIKFIFGIAVYSRGTPEWLPNCSPIWFLTALFVAELMFYWIMKRKHTLLFVIISGILGYLCFLCGKIFPWNIDNALTAVPFIYVGVVLRKYWDAVSKFYYLPLLAVLTIFVFSFGVMNEIDYDGNSIGKIYITGVEAVIVVSFIMSITYNIIVRWGGYFLFQNFLEKTR